jgi:hypothetical protein
MFLGFTVTLFFDFLEMMTQSPSVMDTGSASAADISLSKLPSVSGLRTPGIVKLLVFLFSWSQQI